MIKPLTSLRFFFALMVFTSHIGFVETEWTWYNWLKRNIFFEGYLGVSFFFILSGFVLSYSYQEKFLKNNIHKKSFYIARFARIYPLHVFTFIGILPISYHLGTIEWETLFPNLFLFQSFIPIEKVYYSYNDPSWSISNEMFFYLLFPYYTYLFQKRKTIVLFLIIAPLLLILGISSTNSDYHKTYFYVNPILRSLDFIMGIILFQLYSNKKIKAFIENKANILEFASCLVFIVFLGLHNFIERGYRYSVYYWFPMLFIIFIFSYQKGYLSKILSQPILVLLGEISFGFYMFHYVIIKYSMFIKKDYFQEINDVLFAIALFIVTLIISYFSYKWYEKPINQMIKTKFTR